MAQKRIKTVTRVYEHELDLLKRIAELENKSLAAVIRDFTLDGMHAYRKAHGLSFASPVSSRPVLGYRNQM